MTEKNKHSRSSIISSLLKRKNPDEMMAEAVKMVHGRSKLEASGGITLTRLPAIGKIGVDFVSSGALTHSVKSSDISLDIVAEESL